MLACGTSSTALLRHRSITIQLRLAALYLMHHRLFQQTLFTNQISIYRDPFQCSGNKFER